MVHHLCEYRRAPDHHAIDTFPVDHVQPVSHGGNDDVENLAFACHR